MNATLGTVISGTLKPLDLADAFATELAGLAPDHPLVKEWDSSSYDEDTLTDEQLDELSFLVNDLRDALQEFAPPFCYFGAHQGDGADFGFWFDNDAFEDARRCKEVIEVEPDDAEVIARLVADSGASYACYVNDHGNVTLYDRNGVIVLELV